MSPGHCKTWDLIDFPFFYLVSTHVFTNVPEVDAAEALALQNAESYRRHGEGSDVRIYFQIPKSNLPGNLTVT